MTGTTMTDHPSPKEVLESAFKKIFFYTDVLSYFFIVPLTSAFLLYQIGLPYKQLLIFLIALIIGIAVTFIQVLYSFRNKTKIIRESFYRWVEGTRFSDEEYAAAHKAFFSLPFRHALSGIIRWMIVMPIFIILINFITVITIIQTINMVAILLFNIILCGILYYRVTERNLMKISALGTFNRELHGTATGGKHIAVPLTSIVISTVTLLLIFMTAVVVNLDYSMMKNSYVSQMKNTLSLVNRDFESFLYEHEAYIGGFALNEDIKYAFRTRNYARANAQLAALASGYGYYENAFIALPEMRASVLASARNGYTGIDLGRLGLNKFLVDTLNGDPVLSPVFLSPVSRKPCMLLCVPVKEGNVVKGTINVSLYLSPVSKIIFRNYRIGETGYTLVTDRGLVGIAHPDKDLVGSDLKKTDWGIRMSSLSSGSDFLYLVNKNYNLLYFEQNKRYGFILASYMALSELNNNMLKTELAMLALSLFGLAVVALFMYILINFKLKPLSDYSGIIESMAVGDLNQRIPVQSDDEIGDMSLKLISFNRRLRQAVRNIKSISEELATSSTEMSATVTSFAENSQSQAASAEEVTATVEEMAAGMDNVARSAINQYGSMAALGKQIEELSVKINAMDEKIKNAFSLTESISAKAHDGEVLMKEMSGSMSKIIDSSKEMTGIIGLITGISDQINLLSLNAAIEAARAGDAGRGFAVVADEISKLADQTTSSIKDIDRHIRNNNEETTRGISNSKKTVETISIIIEGVSTMRTMMSTLIEFMRAQTEINMSVNEKSVDAARRSDEIRVASEEQKAAVGEIVKSVTSINEVTQANASGSEELSSTSESLSAMAETLRQAIDYFKV
jgi:methyl-accepting chemotaxis protein